MSKGMDRKKEGKKKPAKSLEEKRAAACGRDVPRVSFAVRATHSTLDTKGDAIDALHTQRGESQVSAWRRELGTKIAWTMVAKVLALALLWLLFFRGHAA